MNCLIAWANDSSSTFSVSCPRCICHVGAFAIILAPWTRFRVLLLDAGIFVAMLTFAVLLRLRPHCMGA